MDVVKEDKKLHDDGIFGKLMGYKEWFHYLGIFWVNGEPLTFMLGTPMSFTGRGAFGWISYKGNQYSLAGNKDTDKNGFFDLQRIQVPFEPTETGYQLWYIAEPDIGAVYKGVITGAFPDYTFTMKTPDINTEITMRIEVPRHSVYQKEVFEWMPDEKRLASWFHSGDVTASITGTIGGKDVTSTDERNRGWYERMWSKVVVLWPSDWLWFMVHLDNGAVFDLYQAKTIDMCVHPLDECWVYQDQIFHEFPQYTIALPRDLEKAIENKDYNSILDKCIRCEGKNKENSFTIDATVTDFRQYEFHDYSANIKYINFMFETAGEAVIDGSSIDMKGRGAAEWAPILYWWV